MSLLDSGLIQQQLISNGFPEPFGLHILETINSTNDYLKTRPKHHPIEICCAETQTQGRGRMNRQWHSPNAENIYCSVRRYVSPQVIPRLSGLSLVTAIAIMDTLTSWQINDGVGIKWPNDIVWQNKKLGGVLIESYQDPAGNNENLAIIIGIGLNVNIQAQNPLWRSKVSRPWCSLFDITGHAIDRNLLLADLMIRLDRHIQQFLSDGLLAFKRAWERWDYLRGKEITLSQFDKIVTGISEGITQDGELIIVDDEQHMHVFSSGETTIRMF
jgi:BirA family biotin operon repressor/biotin-[acetyl-CoA-carboxylase] ligase